MFKKIIKNRIFIAVFAFFVGAFALAGNSTDADTQKQLDAKDTEITKLKDQVAKLEKTEESKEEPKTEETASTKEGEKDYDFSKIDPTEYQQRFVQVALQKELKDKGYNDDTSAVLDDWKISAMNFKDDKTDTVRWTAVTESNSNGRCKIILDWNGGEKDNKYEIRHLLIGGKALVDNMK
jgi:vacuolar-type H+-ATPase subunit I/STV1